MSVSPSNEPPDTREAYTIKVIADGPTSKRRALPFRGDLNAAIKEARHIARTERTITTVEGDGRVWWNSHFCGADGDA